MTGTMVRWSARILLALFLLPGAAVARAGASQQIRVGSWVSVKGDFVERGVFVAREVTLTDERDASLKGPLDGFRADTGELRFGPVVLRADEGTRLQDLGGAMLMPEDVPAGRRAKLSVALEQGGELRVRRVMMLEGSAPGRKIRGPVGKVLEENRRRIRFMLLGVEVEAPAPSRRSVQRPSTLDDEDRRPAKGLSLGALGRLSGEVRFDYRDERNLDLSDDLDGEFTVRGARSELELTPPSTEHISGMFQIKAAHREKRRDDGEKDQRDEFTLGQAFVTFSGILSRYGSLQAGRSLFDDERDWLFRRDLDAVRVFFDFPRFRTELSVSRELLDPQEDQEDITNTLLSLSYFPGMGNVLSAYFFDRSDGFREPDGERRDFSPSYLGIRGYRRGKHLSYWLEAVRVRGSVEGTEIKGKAIDLGVSWTLPFTWEPTLTLGYAMGTGDDDPFDDIDHTFRQTGLQRNNGKWNGVTNFKYYGEALEPELANLRIETYGLGIRPFRRTSIDLIFHRYELDEPASSLVDAAVDDRRLNFLDTDVGKEWDLVIGFEAIPHLELEVDLGYFKAGDAFLGETDPARVVRFKGKFVF
jgi:alginate production protein